MGPGKTTSPVKDTGALGGCTHLHEPEQGVLLLLGRRGGIFFLAPALHRSRGLLGCSPSLRYWGIESSSLFRGDDDVTTACAQFARRGMMMCVMRGRREAVVRYTLTHATLHAAWRARQGGKIRARNIRLPDGGGRHGFAITAVS